MGTNAGLSDLLNELLTRMYSDEGTLIGTLGSALWPIIYGGHARLANTVQANRLEFSGWRRNLPAIAEGVFVLGQFGLSLFEGVDMEEKSIPPIKTPTLIIQRWSYRFAEEVLNARLNLKNEVEKILTDTIGDPVLDLSRPGFNAYLKRRFVAAGWTAEPLVFGDPKDPAAKMDPKEPAAKMDFLKERVGVEVAFSHRSYMGIDLLKLQVASYSALNHIDVGIYVATTNRFQKAATNVHKQNWNGSVSYERICRYLPHFKSAIQVPIYVLGIDIP